MNGSTVFLVAFFTSVATATSTVYLVERLGVFAEKPPETVVPDLRGLSENDARANLEVVGLMLVVSDRRVSAEAPPGTVLSQSVPASQRVTKKSVISVTLAEAAPMVPDVKGRSLSEAQLLLEKEGYKQLVSEKVADPSVPKDHVVAQTPDAGSSLPKGRSVALKVSIGPGEIEVPKLGGMNFKKAQAEVEKLGLKPVVRWVDMAETSSYVVLRQVPGPGEKLQSGEEVQLTVNR